LERLRLDQRLQLLEALRGRGPRLRGRSRRWRNARERARLALGDLRAGLRGGGGRSRAGASRLQRREQGATAQGRLPELQAQARRPAVVPVAQPTRQGCPPADPRRGGRGAIDHPPGDRRGEGERGHSATPPPTRVHRRRGTAGAGSPRHDERGAVPSPDAPCPRAARARRRGRPRSLRLSRRGARRSRRARARPRPEGARGRRYAPATRRPRAVTQIARLCASPSRT